MYVIHYKLVLSLFQLKNDGLSRIERYGKEYHDKQYNLGLVNKSLLHKRLY